MPKTVVHKDDPAVLAGVATVGPTTTPLGRYILICWKPGPTAEGTWKVWPDLYSEVDAKLIADNLPVVWSKRHVYELVKHPAEHK